MKYFVVLTAFFLSSVNCQLKSKDEANSTLTKHGSHYLFKLDNAEKSPVGGKRNSRCTPCGDAPEVGREVMNYLDPEYRGNGADNLGYDWSPRAWGGPAFIQRMKNQGMQYSVTGGWDRGRGGRQMIGDWDRGEVSQQTVPFNCEKCRMFFESRTNQFGGNQFSNRMGRWQGDRAGYQGEIATVTSPPIALRPEGRIAYVPAPGGVMYWDGVSGGGTRWDGFSNGISWLGRNRPYDESWRSNPRNRGGYDQESKQPNYYRPWGNEPNHRPSWQSPGKGYDDRWPNTNQDMRYYGYASQWNYGTTNQNGWNGQNMKWGYGGRNWDNRNKHGYYGGSTGSPPRTKFEDEGNPLPQGQGGPTHSSGQGSPFYPYGQSGASSPYGQGGTIQYGSGGSVYFDQGNYVFHYGNRGMPYDPNRYPQDGKPTVYPEGRPDFGPRPGSSGSEGKPWDYNTNQRHDNREPAYSNINWIRPGSSDGGYPKPDSHGKYPSSGYEDKGNRKPWPQRPNTVGYGPGRPQPGPSFPHGGTGYITGGVTHPGDRYPGDGYDGSRPGGQSGYHGSNFNYPGSGGGSGGPLPSVGGGYPGSIGGSRYPGRPSDSSGYPGPSGGNGYPGSGGDSGYRPPIGGNRYPSISGGSGYPGPSDTGGYPSLGAGSVYPRPTIGGGYPGPNGGFPSSPGVNSYPGLPGGSGPHLPAGGNLYPGSGYLQPDGFGPSDGGYRGNSSPGDSGYKRPGDGGYNKGHPVGFGSSERPYPGPSGLPPKGYYTGFITELDPSKYPNNVNIGQGGNRHPEGAGYPIKDNYPDYDGNRYQGSGGGGDRYPLAGNGYPSLDRDRYYGGNKYPEYEGDRYRPGSGDRFQPNSDGGAGVGGDGNAWNYGQDGGHKDGIYRRAGGSYPPYRGGPYYTSSYLASASTPAGSSQSPSESKTQSVTKADEVTKPTPGSS